MTTAPEVLRFYDDFVKAAPDELSTAVSLAWTPGGEPMISIVACYCGPVDAGEQVLCPLRAFRSPLEDSIHPMAYQSLQSAPDAGFPSGQLRYWKSGWLRHLTDEVIEIMIRFVRQMPSPTTGVGLQHLHGAASRVDRSATAFPHRGAVRLSHSLAVVRCGRLDAKHRVHPGVLRGDAAAS